MSKDLSIRLRDGPHIGSGVTPVSVPLTHETDKQVVSQTSSVLHCISGDL